MRTPSLALAALALALLTGCSGEQEQVSPAAGAARACAQAGVVFERPDLRLADVARLGKAQDAAEAAAAAEASWSGLASSLAALREAATRLAESTQQPTSNVEQSAINAAYVEAETAAQRACAALA